MKGRRKKLTALFLCVVFIAALTACAGKNEGAAHSEEPAVQSEVETSYPETSYPETSETDDRQATSLSGENKVDENTEETEAEDSDTNILIAYFTWAENTHVENPEAVDVDATTSASVLPPGNTAKMADWIRERVGGDLFSIVVTEPYSDNYDVCLDRAADEKAENARPELVYHVENMQDYDVIFLGFPNWWYTAPMAIFSFIEEYDFSGKTIIPFCAHGTGGLAGSVKDITDALPDSAEVLEPIGVYRPDVDSAQPVINDWLDSLGYAEGSMSGTILVEKAEGNDTAGAEERMGTMMKNTIETREYRDVPYDTLSEAQKFDLYLPEAGKSVVDYLDGNILYINVMNRLSVDCDCDGSPAEPDMHDIGILASFDPVALDQACVDLVYEAEDGQSLIGRIESRNGLHTLEQAEKIGLGSREYQLVFWSGH